jgi:hypothetical protein
MSATLLSQKPVSSQALSGERDQLQQSIQRHEALAQQAAQAGDLGEAGRAILAALDCERRMAAKGPQVLQLIKPRQ